jgi:DNA-binding GntR family transcriptional regulator
VATEHAALYDALAARDEDRAEGIMTDHLVRAWSHVERFLASSGARYDPGSAGFSRYGDREQDVR